ncbi:peptidase M52 [Longispora fulva]|uniref:Hydrogenase maturation protease n=1 Tax=Longispora fulva TaxID=619741 RepID=A0A8J7GPE6_9ACTN|nr:hydrogenase maturation protease [Longispora fulva]MBG6135478.1 hydrogenase maturation protease [Longispora fulva]GIG56281.1 peptidase M52 [Longispora fulva]
MTARVLVAGLGNIFLGDDGFGVEVARRLTAEGDLPAGAEVGDFGIRGVHLAYELLSGYDTAILVDATSRGEPPGTVYALDLSAELAGPPAGSAPQVLLDAHGMQPDAVLALLHRMGADIGRVLLVGCEPEDLGDGIGLSPPVAAAVDEAVLLVRALAAEAAEDHTRGGVR